MAVPCRRLRSGSPPRPLLRPVGEGVFGRRGRYLPTRLLTSTSSLREGPRRRRRSPRGIAGRPQFDAATEAAVALGGVIQESEARFGLLRVSLLGDHILSCHRLGAVGNQIRVSILATDVSLAREPRPVTVRFSTGCRLKSSRRSAQCAPRPGDRGLGRGRRWRAAPGARTPKS